MPEPFASTIATGRPMPLLFSYGTLQCENVQQSTFGRLLLGHRDALPGFEQATVRIDDPQLAAASGLTHFANAVVSADRNARIAGTVFEITDAELAAADGYEQLAGYQRIAVRLASGTQAWVYVEARSAPSST